MNDNESKGCERLICNITGGVQPKSIGRRRSVVDLNSGNGTRLEVKWSGATLTYQWQWNVRGELVIHDYDRIILVGANPGNPTDHYRYIFDVPKRWILAWHKPTILCSYNPVKPSDYGYALHNWFACTREQLADWYGNQPRLS